MRSIQRDKDVAILHDDRTWSCSTPLMTTMVKILSDEAQEDYSPALGKPLDYLLATVAAGLPGAKVVNDELTTDSLPEPDDIVI